MYTAFYGLREKPFALLPDPRFLFLAEAHREALAHLLYGIDQGEGFIAVTGEVGTGKTTICRTLLERLGAETEVAFLFNPSRSGIELLQDISAEFGLDSTGLSRSKLGIELNRFLLRKKQERRRVLLIIDEAQNLSHDTLEQVRLLSNLETSSSKLIQILLLGQPELDHKLDSPELRQLRQRISVRWGLRPLTAKETYAYVRHRIKVAAGAERSVFSDAGLREVHRRSGGVPRIVNVLCDRSMLAGYVARQATIGPALVRRAAREIPDARRRMLFSRRRAATGHSRAGAKAFGIGALVVLLVTAAGVLGASERARAHAQAVFAVLSRPWQLAIGTPPSFMSENENVDVASAAPARLVSLDVIADAGYPRSIDPGPFVEVVVDGTRVAAPIEPRLDEPWAAAPGLGEDFSLESATLDLSDASAAAGSEPSAGSQQAGLAPGRVLAVLLASEDPETMRWEALNVILRSFGLANFDRSPANDASMLAGLRQRGLAVLEIEAADIEALRSLNHPALLTLIADDGEARVLALTQLDEQRAQLHGLSGGVPLRVPLDELNEQWLGEAWVIWNDFEGIRPVLAFGERGRSVEWLQRSLAELGYYHGEPSGLFDLSTSDGLRAFQQGRELHADGLAGPRTRMVLYDLLGRYQVPRLAERLVPLEDAG
jgi:general secretion pathway protein A